MDRNIETETAAVIDLGTASAVTLGNQGLGADEFGQQRQTGLADE